MRFDEYVCDISHGFNRYGASRGASAIAQLLVIICVHVLTLFYTPENRSVNYS